MSKEICKAFLLGGIINYKSKKWRLLRIITKFAVLTHDLLLNK